MSLDDRIRHLRELSQCDDVNKLYYENKCHECSELPKSTLFKIATSLNIKGLDDFTSHTSLCKKIARLLTYTSKNTANAYGKELHQVIFSRTLVPEDKEELIKKLVPKHANLFFGPTDNSMVFQAFNHFSFGLTIITPSSLLYLLIQTQLYTESFPEYSEIWEDDKKLLWNGAYIHVNPKISQAVKDFGRWLVIRKLSAIRMSMDRSNDYRGIPRDVKNLIAYQTLLSDCDDSTLLGPRYAFSIPDKAVVEKLIQKFKRLKVVKEEYGGDGKYQHPLVGMLKAVDSKEFKPILTIDGPTLQLYSLASLLNVEEPPSEYYERKYTTGDKRYPLWTKARYCHEIRKRLSLVKPNDIDSFKE